MTIDAVGLPPGYFGNFKSIPTCELISAIGEDNFPRFPTRWIFRNEIGPTDLYCYFEARFGPPNGIQSLLRSNDSDNLVHWEWQLATAAGQFKISGLSYRTEVWITEALPDSAKMEFLKQIKAEFLKFRAEMTDFRTTRLEPWIEFVNPYQRLRRAVTQLLNELDDLELNPKSDSLPNPIQGVSHSVDLSRWDELANLYSKAVGLSFGIRAMLPVMAESFVNLLLFVLARNTIREDKQFLRACLRLPMNIRIRSLPFYCGGFEQSVDMEKPADRDYLQLVTTRNDLLHGNIDIEKLKFNEIYFLGTVPIFKEYSTMWERSHGVAQQAVGLSQVHSELATVNAFVEYTTKLLKEDVQRDFRLICNTFDLGIRKDTKRLGVLFSGHLSDFGMAGEHYADEVEQSVNETNNSGE